MIKIMNLKQYQPKGLRKTFAKRFSFHAKTLDKNGKSMT